jgi:hypothetical protein
VLETSCSRHACAIVALLAAGSISACGGDAAGRRAASTDARRYADPAGWSLAYPGTMHLERSGSGPGRASFSEVTIASFPQRAAVHAGKDRHGGFVRVDPPLDPGGAFPADRLSPALALP